MKNKKVLLTGVTGFLGSHTAIQLLNQGYRVVGTARNADKIEPIKEVLAEHTSHIHNLDFAVADLGDQLIWDELSTEVDFIQHIASPFPRQLPRHEDELILPARNGTLAILRAAAANNVKRVVITSSMAAVAYGRPARKLRKTFDENDWTNEHSKKDITPYYKSKTVAEKAAWDFIGADASGLELVTVCPGAVLGPVLEKDFGTSANLILSILNGSFPALPKVGFDIVDVRSVADLLIRAMEIPEANGNRYLGASEYLTLREIAGILEEHYPERKIPLSVMPNFVSHTLAFFTPELRPIMLETIRRKTNLLKARKELGWEPVSAKDAVLACADSLFAQKILI
ncbi:SDR family oxidoreductase [Dyadobacter crusticola]|uniref:SDR family oxidoreductase n=1 Tax=Dyadobacter crusticola TaxID=292407 RepID=UPI0004E11FC5|nr:aldehyde reductase [Dyadobacter crusticola]